MTESAQNIESWIASGKPFDVPSELEAWLKRWKRLFIEGAWVDGVSGEVFTTTNPATERELSEISLARRPDVERAVDSARKTFDTGPWRTMPIKERGKKIRGLGDLILKHRAELAILESLDTGKPIRESYEGDILRAAQNFHFFAELSEKQTDKIFKGPTGVHTAIREPMGVVALITPWNLPLYLATWKIAPALLMGNSVILKPSELTPLTATYFTELLEKSDLPPGVFTLLHGLGDQSTGEYLVSHPGIDAISFTGETGTGRRIMQAASCGPTRVSFELGGKGAAILFNDFDLKAALPVLLRSSYRNQGEICLACPRIYVDKSRFDEFVEVFSQAAAQLQVGNPLCGNTEMGALISESHLEKVSRYLREVEPPARIVTGGERPAGLEKGYFLRPTVVTGVDAKHRITQEEIFGPVVSVYPFESEPEVVSAANGTAYGLSASVWTQDKNRAERVSHALRSGLVWVNGWFVRDLNVPFGGQKRSGVGREGGEFSLDFYSEWKSVHMNFG